MQRKRLNAQEVARLRITTGWMWRQIGRFLAKHEGRPVPYQAPYLQRLARPYMPH